MEDRRCRKVMALILTTVIILSVSVQNVSAVPERSTDKLYTRAIDIKQTVLAGMVSDFKRTFLTNIKGDQYLQILKDKFIGKKEKGSASKDKPGNEIILVIEQIPLEQVLGTKDPKVQHDAPKRENEGTNKNSKNNVNTAIASRSVGADILREDIELLARIIHAEARGESFEGQVAVGAVVLNRVSHPDFPKSIREVVYQSGQFSAVKDKQIELTPNSKAYQAAQAALEGQDPSNGAIYYYNPKIATDRWIRTRSIIRSIGNHKFCV